MSDCEYFLYKARSEILSSDPVSEKAHPCDRDGGQHPLQSLDGRPTSGLGTTNFRCIRKDGRISVEGQTNHGLPLYVPPLQGTSNCEAENLDQIQVSIPLYLNSLGMALFCQ